MEIGGVKAHERLSPIYWKRSLSIKCYYNLKYIAGATG
jgi:hypothetical protein